MNNKYIIRVGHPLLRPGLTIETEASEHYAVQVVETLMAAVRKINNSAPVVSMHYMPQDHERPGDPE